MKEIFFKMISSPKAKFHVIFIEEILDEFNKSLIPYKGVKLVVNGDEKNLKLKIQDDKITNFLVTINKDNLVSENYLNFLIKFSKYNFTSSHEYNQ